MFFNSVVRLFESGNVSVCGLRGTGKDMLFSNVIARRKQPYISNCDYHCVKSAFIKLDFSKIDLDNNYSQLLKGDIIPYDYPYPENADFYISDAGIYLPSQYQGDLIYKYKGIPTFAALSRHLGNCNFHFNSQNIERVWDKLREQSDIYIRCESCYVLKFLPKIPILGRLFKNIVIQKITIYDKYQSCVDRVQPFKPLYPKLFSSKEERAVVVQQNDTNRNQYRNTYGKVIRHTIIYKNLSNYDTRLFKSLLRG